MSWTRSPREEAAAGWREWGDKNHGAGWKATRERYFRHPFTLSRCLWCRTHWNLQLNHLTYKARSKRHRVYGDTGWIRWPLYLFVLVPMCPRCHEIEGWLTRKVFRRHVRRAGAHVGATFVPYLLSRALVIGLLWWAAVRYAGAPPPDWSDWIHRLLPDG